ncbi:hypothetical protein BKP56_12715 [Marinilactibacillus sp. 15R]|uniref:hypothetical protein n=1 Tax=Marinilactibacillus sp. 15R TaxID=1911586 RepID=UPI00090C309F|nr:hypothetical protein [Marinilactibacillus sp. 15R]API90063.1 hypothetical protein BKP56_12715 [Marinilactibacillus sp. 15R]
MSKKKSKLKLAQKQVELVIQKTNGKIGELGIHTSQLYDELKTLQKLFEDIRNAPIDTKLEYEQLKSIRLNWKQQAEKIESDSKTAAAKNAGKGAAGAGVGIAVATLGPTAAMGVATTFGVASTGTAISTLSGTAATNAALAWLGGGTLAAKGGGMVAGKALLGLAGPVGWAISGVALVGSGFLLWKGKNDKNRLEDIFTLISKRDAKSYELAIVELNERIKRIIDESQKLRYSIERTREFGLDYNRMTEAQQHELGSYVNLMNSSTQLLVNPITGLQLRYDMNDLKKYIASSEIKVDDKKTKIVIFLSNLLYKINLDEKDKKLLWKFFKGNKKFLSSIEISKKDFEFSIIETISDALEHKYSSVSI